MKSDKLEVPQISIILPLT